MVGWRYAGRLTICRAQQAPGGCPGSDDRRSADSTDRRRRAIASSMAVATSKATPNVVAGEGTGIVHIAPGCGDVDHQHRQAARTRRHRSAGRRRHASSKASAPFTGKSATDPATADLVFDELEEEGLARRRRRVSAHLSALLADRRRTGLPARRRVVHQHGLAGGDQGCHDSRSTGCPTAIAGPGPRARMAHEHARLDDLQEALLGPRAADLGQSRTIRTDFEVIGSLAELKERAGRGLGRVRGPHAAPAVDRRGQDQEPEDRRRCCRASRTSAIRGSTRGSFRSRRWASTQQSATTVEEVVSRRLRHRMLPRPVPQLVLLAAVDGDDDAVRRDGRSRSRSGRSRRCSATAS